MKFIEVRRHATPFQQPPHSACPSKALFTLLPSSARVHSTVISTAAKTIRVTGPLR